MVGCAVCRWAGVRMARLLALLFVVAGLVVLAPTPVHASPSLTIRASDTVLLHGASVRFSGRARDTRRGSVVKLQRRTRDGWRTVARTRVRATRRYSFTTTPPRGYRSYRVFKPRQRGQRAAASPRVRLTVQWYPRLDLAGISNTVDPATGAVTTHTSGMTTGLAGGTALRREVEQPDGSWVTHGWVQVADDGSWDDTFTSSQGMYLRYASPAAGARLPADSGGVRVDARWTPAITVAAAMDDHTDEVRVAGSTSGLPAGFLLQRQYFGGEIWFDEGEPVAVAADGSFTDSFAASMYRDYRYLAAGDGGLRDEATSATFTFTEAPVTRVSLNSTTTVVFPDNGPTRTLVVHLEQDQVFTLHSRVPNGAWTTVTSPSGEELPGFGDSFTNVTATAPATGDYTIRFERPQWATSRETAWITLSEPVVYPTELDAPGLDLRSNLPGQVVDLRFAAEGGTLLSEYGVPHVQEPGFVPGDARLLDPAGNPVATFGELPRQGLNWRLPAASGDYTLRFTPTGGDRVDRQGQAVLRGLEVSATLDGAPGHLSLDRPGRVGLVSLTTPAGLHVDFIHTAQPSDVYRRTEFFHPDGRPYNIGGHTRAIDRTEAGTYTALVSVDASAATFDFYGFTPARYTAEVGSTSTFDQGPALERQARVTVPVTAGQTFSFDAVSATRECGGDATIVSGSDTLEWWTTTTVQPHPEVFKVARSGELELAIYPCALTGTFRLPTTTAVSQTVTGSTTTADGTYTTGSATLRASDPGQVLLLRVDPPANPRNTVTMWLTKSTFPTDTSFLVSHLQPGSAWSRSLRVGRFGDLEPAGIEDVSGENYFLIYPAPGERGSIDVDLRTWVPQ